MTRSLIPVLFVLLLQSGIGVDSIQAGELFSGSGQDIFNDPSVTFPSRPPVLSGTSLVFEAGSTNHDLLFSLPLFQAGTLNCTDPIEISVSIQLTRLISQSNVFPEDSDPQWMISDGTNAVGFAAQDNNSGRGIAKDGSVTPGTFTQVNSEIMFTNAGYPPIGQSFTATTDFTLKMTSSVVTGAFGTGSGTNTISLLALDRTKAWSFVFGAGEPCEQYQINSLTITIKTCPCDLIAMSDFGAPMGKKKKLGSTIPVKFKMFLDEIEITSQADLDLLLELAGFAKACPEILITDVTDPANAIGLELPEELDNVGEGGELGSCFRYSDGNWIYNLKLPEATPVNEFFFSGNTYLVEVEIGDCIFMLGNDLFQIK